MIYPDQETIKHLQPFTGSSDHHRLKRVPSLKEGICFFVPNQLSSMPPSRRQQQPANFNLGSQTVGLPPSSVVCSIPAGVLNAVEVAILEAGQV